MGASSNPYIRGRFLAGDCIDGNVNSPCVLLGDNAYLSAEMPSGVRAGLVALHNRNKANAAGYLRNYEVWVSDTPGFQTPATGQLCGSGSAPATVGPFTLTCNGMVGQYVTLQLPGRGRVLSLQEMFVYPYG